MLFFAIHKSTKSSPIVLKGFIQDGITDTNFFPLQLELIVILHLTFPNFECFCLAGFAFDAQCIANYSN